jgi:deoxyribodipyrimidine photo-lyase
MEKSFKKTLFLFRRDLRLEDNTGLLFALKRSEQVIPAFIFTQEQIEHNPFRSDHCLQFMLDALDDLNGSLNECGSCLYLFRGSPHDVVAQLIKELGIDALVINRDYTPYSKERDSTLEALCRASGIAFYAFDDALLHAPETTVKKDGAPYTVFTAFYKNALHLPVAHAVKTTASNYFRGSISSAQNRALLTTLKPQKLAPNIIKGSRKEALAILDRIGDFQDYVHVRDIPALDATTHLSAYLKFTLLSPREVYHAIKDRLGIKHGLIRALFWRDFFTSIAFFFPHVFTGSFHQKYDRVSWSYDEEIFARWKTGTTGFPIVDAGMREMNATGFMHNRVRMITGSFLVKDLHIDWRRGEKYFAQTLIDYDPAVNNGNWQWVAGTGCDAQPYFRIFNPWLQQKKFDPECLYIKKWIPALKHLPAKVIHTWYDSKHGMATHYSTPIVQHEREAKRALAIYKSL